jgi:hypothetical protein
VVQRLRVVKGTLVADELHDWANGLTSPDGTTVARAYLSIEHAREGWFLKLTITMAGEERGNLIWDFFVEHRGKSVAVRPYADGGAIEHNGAPAPDED